MIVFQLFCSVVWLLLLVCPVVVSAWVPLNILGVLVRTRSIQAHLGDQSQSDRSFVGWLSELLSLLHLSTSFQFLGLWEGEKHLVDTTILVTAWILIFSNWPALVTSQNLKIASVCITPQVYKAACNRRAWWGVDLPLTCDRSLPYASFSDTRPCPLIWYSRNIYHHCKLILPKISQLSLTEPLKLTTSLKVIQG